MATLTLNLGQEYGRNSGALVRTADFSNHVVKDGPAPVYFNDAAWYSPPDADGNRHLLTSVIGERVTEFQGSPPVNGLSLHTWNNGTAYQTFSLIGTPLEAWEGHRVVVHSGFVQGTNHQSHLDVFDLVFVTSDAVTPDHSVGSIGPGHWHPSPDDYRRLKERVAALETESALRKGAAAGKS